MENELTIKNNTSESAIAVEQSRAMQEVQGAIVMAKQFPRDENTAYNKITQACKRLGLAEKAMYSYPKGGTQVTGVSIRLAETLAKYWGNIQFGIVELSQSLGSSDIMAYAWDLETNTRQVKQFSVKHIRYSRNKGNTKLTDPRDIYEIAANQGARRLRACILGVLPSDFIDGAVVECEKTLRGVNNEPLVDRVRKCVASFTEIGITQEMIEKKLGHNLEATNVHELVNLGKVYNSIKDNMSSAADHFTFEDKANFFEDQKEKAKNTKKTPKPKEIVEEVKAGPYESSETKQDQLTEEEIKEIEGGADE